jgi:hypothetical protein
MCGKKILDVYLFMYQIVQIKFCLYIFHTSPPFLFGGGGMYDYFSNQSSKSNTNGDFKTETINNFSI